MAREPFKNTVAGIIILGVISGVIAAQFGFINIRRWFDGTSSGSSSSAQSRKEPGSSYKQSTPESGPSPTQQQSVRLERPTPITHRKQDKVDDEILTDKQDQAAPLVAVTKSEAIGAPQNVVQQEPVLPPTALLPLQCHGEQDPFDADRRHGELDILAPAGATYVSGTGHIYTARKRDGRWQATSKWIKDLSSAAGPSDDYIGRYAVASDLPVGTFMVQWVISDGSRNASCAAVVVVDKTGRYVWEPIK